MTYILTFTAGNRISDYILKPERLPNDAQLVWMHRKKMSHFVQHILMFVRNVVLRSLGCRLFSSKFFTDETLQALNHIQPSDRVILFDIFNAKILSMPSSLDFC